MSAQPSENASRPLFFALFLPTLGLRICSTGASLVSMERSTTLLLHCVRGVLSDLLVCLLLASLSRWLVPRWLRPLFLLCWCFLLACNREFIAVNASNLNLDFLTKGDQGNFLRGSVLIPSLFAWAFFSLSLSLSGIWLSRRFGKGHQSPFLIPVFLTATALVLTFWAPDGNLLTWLQANPIEENYTLIFRKNSRTQELLLTGEQNEALRKIYLAQDLSGKKLLSAPQAEKRNILFLVVESLSEYALDQGMMPFLSGLRTQGIYASNFIAQNRQTHTGLHAIFCGEVPNLSERVSKADIVGVQGTRKLCLPSLLRELGYVSVFMQAGDLSFTRQDRISKAMGFEELLENSDFPSAVRYDQWGPEDVSFLDEVLNRVQKLESGDRPWLTAAMTIGTHHPFGISPEDKKEFSGDDYFAAFRRADRALEKFMKAFQEKGFLKNTLVIIVGDEAGAPLASANVPEGQLPGNRGFLLALSPEGIAKQQKDYFAQSDLLLSVLDYLGEEHPEYPGRSVFRDYEGRFRPLLFSHILLNRMYDWETPNELRLCDQSIHECSAFRLDEAHSGDLFGASFQLQATNPTLIRDMQKLAEMNDLRLLPNRSGVAFHESNLSGTGLFRVYHGFKTDVFKGQTITWFTKMKADPKNVSSTHFWLSIYDWNVLDTPLIDHQLDLQPGEERDFEWRYLAEKDMVLESTLEFGQAPDSRMLVEESRIEVR